jgi:hypothetical protein
MNRPDDIPKTGLNDEVVAAEEKSVDLLALARKRRISRRRIILALSLSLLGGILLIWLLQKPPEDAVESRTVHIQPAVAEPEPDSITESMLPVSTGKPVGEASQSLIAAEEEDVESDRPVTIGDLISQVLVDNAEHPLDPVLAVAKLSMEEIDNRIQDYTCVITSQVFVDDRLDKERRMRAKIRHSHEKDGQPKPFAVYLDFLSPRKLTGQEVIWVEGQNDGKLIAHAASGFLRLKRMHVAPDGPIAMRGSRYPIWDIGIRNLIGKMYEIGCCDRDDEDCQVIVTPGVKVEGRVSTLIEIKHEAEKEIFQFHHAKIYVDNERKIPIGYEGYSWPQKPEDPPPLMEKFYYTDMNLNVGLTDSDFDPDNPDYSYPAW